ncbi:MAG: hypothetical protein AAGC77_12450 [Pseudomonadota bacterium]
MRLFLLIMVVFTTSTPLRAQPNSDDKAKAVQAMGVYVASDDLQRSAVFYQTLFEKDPVIRLPDFIAFDIEGGWFAIASREKYAPGSQPGAGAVPYIQSGDLEEMRERVARATEKSAPAIIVEPGIQILKVEDPDGQLVEFFSFQ